MQRVIAFGRRHPWPVTMAAITALIASLCGLAFAVSAWMHGLYLVGWFGGAACGDVLIWAVMILLALWLPRKRTQVT